MKSSLMSFTAYRIVLFGEIQENEMGGPSSTYSWYRNKDGFRK